MNEGSPSNNKPLLILQRKVAVLPPYLGGFSKAQPPDIAQKYKPCAVILSHREQQVLDLLLQELTNKQISVQLGISEKTVEKILHNIYQKTGACCRVGAVIWALKRKDGG